MTNRLEYERPKTKWPSCQGVKKETHEVKSNWFAKNHEREAWRWDAEKNNETEAPMKE